MCSQMRFYSKGAFSYYTAIYTQGNCLKAVFHYYYKEDTLKDV